MDMDFNVIQLYILGKRKHGWGGEVGTASTEDNLMEKRGILITLLQPFDSRFLELTTIFNRSKLSKFGHQLVSLIHELVQVLLTIGWLTIEQSTKFFFI